MEWFLGLLRPELVIYVTDAAEQPMNVQKIDETDEG